MAIVVEVLGKNKRVEHRYFFSQHDITVGRAYDCDVIIDDIHVDPRHLYIRPVEDGLLIKDLGSLNGVFDWKKKALAREQEAASKSEIRIGETYLRIVDTSHPVADTALLNSDSIWRTLGQSPWLGFGLLLVVGGMSLYQTWVNTVDNLSVTEVVSTLVTVIGVVLSLSAILSFIAKVVKREWRFGFHLVLCAALMIASDLSDVITSWVAFNFPIREYVWLLDALWLSLFIFILARGLCYSLMNVRPWLQGTIVSSAVLLVFGLSTVDKIFVDEDQYSAIPPMTPLFRPMAYRLRTPITDQAFLEQAQSVFEIPLKENDDIVGELLESATDDTAEPF